MTSDDATFAAMLQQQFNRQGNGFAVVPITTCPHIPTAITPKAFIGSPCKSCDETQENWQCLTCDTVRCSRYRHGHMLEHFEQTQDHAVCLSYSDLSVWCFICENYVVNEESCLDQNVDTLVIPKNRLSIL
ncbi:hypothetical protein BJV82DRAFT_597436 [Fennellomyces sp. T-0311]|nr:hypothetical protein BJV82DRAFT_597436 [Fennellomyces sp. T-0311]